MTEIARSTWLQRAKRAAWLLLVGAVVLWSVWLLYTKLLAEVSADPLVKELLAGGGLWNSLKVIYQSIAQSVIEITRREYLQAAAAAVVAYIALAWYDRIALIHLNRHQGISWSYIATCSFVTYALGHNLGASVLSGGLVRLRAYCAKGLSAAEVGVLVALCSFTFAFGTMILMGFVFLVEPEIVQSLDAVIPFLVMPVDIVRLMGIGLLLLCGLYVLGSWRGFAPVRIRNFEIFYPKLPIVTRQLIAAPLEVIAAAAIVYFVLPDVGNPGFLIVLGAFVLSFSAGLVSQTPGGIGVMEAVFLAVVHTVPPSDVIAALLIWRLFYLLIPLALSLPVVVAFERAQLRGKTT
jgi:uncharacterized membrane protein YbhN (UPF0104 family)